ncbi:MAG: DNA polymerase IV [Bacillota bacterium]
MKNLQPCGRLNMDDVRTDLVHVDMDAFFAAVEQRDDPTLRGRPVVVGGSPESRGVVSTCSYEARRYGVRSAMPSARARSLCPEAVFRPPDFSRYREASLQIRSIMTGYSELIEPAGLDEAFLLVPPSGGDPVEVARRLKEEVGQKTELTCSVGLSYNKPLAKLASEWEKPDGFTVIDQKRARSILPSVSLDKLWGVGPQTVRELRRHGIVTCADFNRADRALLLSVLGPSRAWDMALLCSGMSARGLSPGGRAKSISQERTLEHDVDDPRELEDHVRGMVADVGGRLRERGLTASTVTLKVRCSDFRTLTRSTTMSSATADEGRLTRAALDLLARLFHGGYRIRLLGVSLSNFDYPDLPEQLRLPLEGDGSSGGGRA